MKYFLAILFFCFCACHCHAQTKVYTGKINGKYEIEMHLRTFGKETYGYYFYKTQNKPIPLHAKQNGYKIKLLEGDETENNVFFDGALNGKSFKGYWRNVTAKKTLPFSLTEIKTEKTDAEKAKYSGIYKIFGNDKEKTLDIKYINDKYFYFEISLGSSTCTGYINGIAETQTTGQGTYHDEGCKQLSFTFKDRSAEITEDSCDGYHGSACEFSGTYPKK